jgi:hypothetical protein
MLVNRIHPFHTGNFMNLTNLGIHQARWVGVWVMAGAVLIGTPVPRASAQAVSPAPISAVVTASTNATIATSAAAPQGKAPATYSRGIDEIMKLVDAGVSKEIMKAFVETSSIAFEVGVADIVALKQRGVSDEVTAALLKRSAEVKVVIGQQRERATIAAPAIVREFSTDGKLDPDSYEFWYYHYAYPRALAESYRTLSPYQLSYRRSYPSRYPVGGSGFRASSFQSGRR